MTQAFSYQKLAEEKLRCVARWKTKIKEFNSTLPGAIPPVFKKKLLTRHCPQFKPKIFFKNMETLPPEMQEKVFKEVVKQKVEDEKRMGWDIIHKVLECQECVRRFKTCP